MQLFGDETHNRSKNDSSDNGHDDQGTANLKYWVLGSSSFKPSAKMVGNISDIKKLVRNIAHNPTQPGSNTPIATSATLMEA
jgi:hypothetical protein